MHPFIENLESRRLMSAPGIVQTIDSVGDVGQYTSVALNPVTGNPAVAYYDVTHGDLKFASFDGTKWSTSTVDSGGNVGRVASLAIDTSGNAYIAYSDTTNGDLKVASGGINHWNITTVDSAGGLQFRGYISLALTKAGLPRIAYTGLYGANEEGLKFASFDGSSWTNSAVDVVEIPAEMGGLAESPSLALDGNDRPRIGYIVDFSIFRFASFDGSQWNIETVYEEYEFNISHAQLALDSDGHPHISFATEYRAAQYLENLGAGWTNQKDMSGDFGYDESTKSMVLDSNNKPFISTGGEALGLLDGSGNEVRRKLLDHSDRVGEYSSMTIDSSDTLYIAYYDQGNGDLKFYTGKTDARPAQQFFQRDATFNDLAVGADATVHFAYWVHSSSGFPRDDDLLLHYATLAPDGTSHSSIIDKTVNAGPFVSAALDSAGRFAVAYYDAGPANLKYAKLIKGKWHIETVDTKGAVGLYPSIAFDSNDHAVISYYDRTHGNLKLAHSSGTGWAIQTVDSTGDVGRFSKIAIDPVSRRFSIAYEKPSSGEFRFAQQKSNGTFAITVVDTTQQGGGHISLAYDQLNQPAFTYYDAYNADLKIARRVNGRWKVKAVATKRAQGLYSRLFFSGKNNQANIIYYNRSEFRTDLAAGDGVNWTARTIQQGGGYNSFAQNALGKRFISYRNLSKNGLMVEELT